MKLLTEQFRYNNEPYNKLGQIYIFRGLNFVRIFRGISSIRFTFTL